MMKLNADISSGVYYLDSDQVRKQMPCDGYLENQQAIFVYQCPETVTMTFFLGSGKNPICCDPKDLLVEFWGVQSTNHRIALQEIRWTFCKVTIRSAKIVKKTSWNPQVALQPLLTCLFFFSWKRMVNRTDEIFAGENWLPNIHAIGPGPVDPPAESNWGFSWLRGFLKRWTRWLWEKCIF